MSIKVIAFDLFGTVFDASTVDRDEVLAYVRHVRNDCVEWLPLLLPASWSDIPAHPDSAEGLRMLRAAGFKVVTCTNWPECQIDAASNNADIEWDHKVLLERYRIYKPHLSAYAAICQELGVAADEVLMVTANPGAGDDTRPALIGMKSQVIREPGTPETIIELAKQLEAAK